MFSRPPNDLSHLPAACSVKALLEVFRNHNAERGLSTRLYDEPDPGIGDRDVIRRLNKLLERNPDTPMPEGYRRVADKDLHVSYEVPEQLGLRESQRISTKIIDDLLSSIFGIHILEP